MDLINDLEQGFGNSSEIFRITDVPDKLGHNRCCIGEAREIERRVSGLEAAASVSLQQLCDLWIEESSLLWRKSRWLRGTVQVQRAHILELLKEKCDAWLAYRCAIQDQLDDFVEEKTVRSLSLRIAVCFAGQHQNG